MNETSGIKILNQSFIIVRCKSNVKQYCVVCNKEISENIKHPYIQGSKDKHLCNNVECQRQYIINDIEKQME